MDDASRCLSRKMLSKLCQIESQSGSQEIGQSIIDNVPTLTVDSKPAGFRYDILNDGNSDILINGKVVKAGFVISWQGAFNYNSQSSTITIITNP